MRRARQRTVVALCFVSFCCAVLFIVSDGYAIDARALAQPQLPLSQCFSVCVSVCLCSCEERAIFIKNYKKNAVIVVDGEIKRQQQLSIKA